MNLDGADSDLGRVGSRNGGGAPCGSSRNGRPQMVEIAGGAACYGGSRKGSITRSLLISPNLDALLEHEERKRGQPPPPSPSPSSLATTTTTTATQHATVGPRVDISVGLPPPPRRTASHRTRRRGMERETAEGTENMGSGSGKGSAGKKRIGGGGGTALYHSSEGSGGSVVGENEDNLSSPPGSPEEERPRFVAAGSAEVGGSGPGRRRYGLDGGSPVISTGAAAVAVAAAAHGTSSSASNPYINPAPESRVIGYNDGAGQDGQWSMETREQDRGGNDMREKALPLLPDGVVNGTQRRTEGSIDSGSTHGPPSTEENGPRISISSTIYPPSDNYDLYHHHHHHHQDMDDFIQIHAPTPIPLTTLDHTALVVDDDDKPPKPPLPTTPKPNFSRSFTPRGLLSRHASLKGTSQQSFSVASRSKENAAPLPPTTNFLDLEERADLVRKSRKLARVFGETPSPDAMAHQESGRSPYHQPARPFAANGSIADDIHAQRLPPSSWRQPPDSPRFTSIRRHSVPIIPDDVSFISLTSPTNEGHPSPLASEFPLDGDADAARVQPSSSSNNIPRRRPASPTSFMDFSDDGPDDPAIPPASSKSSTFTITSDTATISDPLEDERRRKRERLAKLHRFLGSHVPANLVLGIDDPEASLPPIRPISVPPPTSPDHEDGRRKWLGRRRSSSAAMHNPYADTPERLKEDLDEREKAINVRRAQKMEKVFGVAPPLTLYHTRHTPSPSIPVGGPPLHPGTLVGLSFAPEMDAQPTKQRNPNRSSYIKSSPNTSNGARSSTNKKTARPGTAESSKQLIDKGQESYGFDERFPPATDVSVATRHSLIYSHYQHSLNSLSDMMDRDDKESLAELHHYLHGGAKLTSPSVEDAHPTSTRAGAAAPARERRPSYSSSHKSERRRSLPARTSLISMSSEYSLAITSPRADASSFQTRRRRAAKLTQFFGVNYRELIGEVLESLECGVEQEHRRGTLHAAEVEDLLVKLRNLKAKRQSYI